MLNKIWFWLVVIGILYAPTKALVRPVLPLPPVPQVDGEAAPTVAGYGQLVTTAAFDGANAAVELCFSLIPFMVLWLGLMQIAKDAGVVDGIAWALRPVMRWLFPDVPEGHPAQGAILMNLSANLLGLDNAATPMGLQAMRELQTLNPQKETATNSMAMFLAINTSSITLIPFSIIGLRVAAKSENPAAPVFAMIVATVASTIVAIAIVRSLQGLPGFAPPPATPPEPEAA